MSNEAISWALKQPIKPSSTKFILVVMANCANENFIAFPSTAYLCEATCQDRKTVLENMKRLRDLGYIEETGEHAGRTAQVPVYRLKSPENGTVSDANVDPTVGSEKTAIVPKTALFNSTENGTVPKTVPVPNFPSNGTVFPMKQSQNSHETVPKTGHGNQRETLKETKGKPNNRTRKSTGTENGTVFILPDWVPQAAWDGYIEMRRKKRKPPTDHACDLVVAELAKLKAKGQDIAEVLNQSTRAGWTDVYPLKQQSLRTAPQQQSLDEINAEAYRIAFPNRAGVIDG